MCSTVYLVSTQNSLLNGYIECSSIIFTWHCTLFLYTKRNEKGKNICNKRKTLKILENRIFLFWFLKKSSLVLPTLMFIFIWWIDFPHTDNIFIQIQIKSLNRELKFEAIAFCCVAIASGTIQHKSWSLNYALCFLPRFTSTLAVIVWKKLFTDSIFTYSRYKHNNTPQ